MGPEEIYQNLLLLAEKLAINISEENFRVTKTKIKSGYCKVKGKDHYIIDKHLPLSQKVNLLGAFLAQRPLEDLYVLPAVRAFLDKFELSETETPEAPDGAPANGLKNDTP